MLIAIYSVLWSFAFTVGGWTGVIMPFVAGLGALGVWRLATLHERGQLPPFVTNFGFLMSYLDQITDRQKLQAMFDAKPVTAARYVPADELQNALEKDIIGHPQVIKDVVLQVSGNLAQEKRTGPLGVFMFAGPPSTGKTEFGFALGRALFGKAGYYRVEMNNFSQPSSISTLFGASTGLNGSDSMSSFITHLATNPNTVIILDEFEKAHDSVQKGFLSAWNEGVITEMTRGRQISTEQALFVVTTNAAQDEITQTALAYTGDRDGLSDQCKIVLAPHFDSALLSRIDYVFPLLPLKQMDLANLLSKIIIQLVESYGMTLRSVAEEIMYDYVAHATRQNIDVRAMKRKIKRDVRESLVELKRDGVSDISITTQAGQIMVRKYVPPVPKKPKVT